MLKIKYNARLKAAIKERGLMSGWIARQIGIDAAYMSGFITGHRIPTEKQQRDIAGVLGVDVDSIF